jgi:hypothetical protein
VTVPRVPLDNSGCFKRETHLNVPHEPIPHGGVRLRPVAVPLATSYRAAGATLRSLLCVCNACLFLIVGRLGTVAQVERRLIGPRTRDALAVKRASELNHRGVPTPTGRDVSHAAQVVRILRAASPPQRAGGVATRDKRHLGPLQVSRRPARTDARLSSEGRRLYPRRTPRWLITTPFFEAGPRGEGRKGLVGIGNSARWRRSDALPSLRPLADRVFESHPLQRLLAEREAWSGLVVQSACLAQAWRAWRTSSGPSARATAPRG